MNEFNSDTSLNNKVFNSDKFTYHEGEIKLYDCICEECTYYNDGKRREKCPSELLDLIKKNEIRCPNFHSEYSFFD